MEFHHVGVATPDAAAVAERYESLFDLPVVHEEAVGDLSVVFLDAGAGYVELLEPSDGGTVQRFLDREGPGLHHVAFETADAAAALDDARAAGVTPIDDEPRPGAWGHEVAFLHPGDLGGVLVELVETHG
ncbi:MAG: methylmalonyl-CoA epimerase [Halobacteriaceae archaeon]